MKLNELRPAEGATKTRKRLCRKIYFEWCRKTGQIFATDR